MKETRLLFSVEGNCCCGSVNLHMQLCDFISEKKLKVTSQKLCAVFPRLGSV